MRLHADGVDHGVRSAAFCQIPHGGHDVVVLVEVQHLHAVAARHLHPLRHAVYAKHPLGAPVPRDAGTELPDGSQPVDRHATALRDVGEVHGLPGRRQDVREVQEPLVGRAFGDLYGPKVSLRHPQVLGLASGDLAIELGVAEEGGPLVILAHLRRLALGVELPVAHKAVPARDVERHHHPVSRGDVLHISPDLLDDPHRLVPDDVALLEPHSQYSVEMQVRAADRRRGDSDYRVRGLLEPRIGDRVHPYVFLAVPCYRFHQRSPPVIVCPCRDRHRTGTIRNRPSVRPPRIVRPIQEPSGPALSSSTSMDSGGR